jgi:type VI protein secretion system component VasK
MARTGTARVGPMPAAGGVYDRAAEPVLAYAARLGTVADEDATALLRHAGTLLDRFAADLTRAGAVPSTVAPARYALALVLDAAARRNRAIGVQVWAAGAQRYLFDGRDMTVANIRDFVRVAAEAGHDFDALRGFLERCLARLSAGRVTVERGRQTNWAGMYAVLVLGFGLAVLGWAGWVEWKQNRGLQQVFDAEALDIGLDRAGRFPDLAARLDRLAAAAARVDERAAQSPIRLFAPLFGYDAAANAGAVYRDAVARQVPPVVAAAIDDAVATEGDPVILYDALRAWSVIDGAAGWSAAYVAGWLTDRAVVRPDLAGLAPHALALTGPGTGLTPPDAELLAQARSFAAEAEEAARAYLELRRSDAAAALTPWVADRAVPGLSDILQRRSGLPMDAPIDGIFTAAGWDHARDVGAGLAVQAARTVAATLFDAAPPTQNDAPDRVLDQLQKATLATWSAYVADLRVRPFSDADAAILISGRLSERVSPIDQLLRAVWNEAGGNDRRRTHTQQIAVATTFAPAIQYVEQGHLADISALFAALNVALGVMDRDEEAGLQRLMSVTDRAQSVAALRQAPAIVVQLVEDVLAQTAQSHADMLTNPLTRAWQAEALPACKQVTEGQFPFAAGGGDADLALAARLLAPGGTLDRFFAGRVAPYIDTSASPWRWKPEARFEGLTPDSAAFFERAQALKAGLFAAGDAPQVDLTLSALAERGKAFMSLGGQGGPVEATTESLRLTWPGPDPAQGIEVTFQSPGGDARLAEAGAWGLLRLLGPLRLRERDGGQRFLVDLRSGGARLFLEIGFGSPGNPLAVRGLLKDFACPAVL